MQLLVTMAIPKKGISRFHEGFEGYAFECARIEILDWETKKCVRKIEYRPPSENLGEGLSVRFTGGFPYEGKWFQTSGTELIIYNTFDWSVEKVISHNSFHDLHGVMVVDGEIVLVNTGLEMIQFLDMNGTILREVNVASTPTWERFDHNIDYRRVVSTKPHEAHPNHAFQIDGQWWVTRCLKCDAINLEDHQQRINIEVGQPHDGIIRGDYLYFTTTNAHLVIADVSSRKVVDVINLNALNDSKRQLGWCRGLEVVGNVAYIGFSRLRESKWKETFRTARNVLRGQLRDSHIDKIDIKRRLLVDSYEYGPQDSSAIFTLMAYDRVIGKTLL